MFSFYKTLEFISQKRIPLHDAALEIFTLSYITRVQKYT